MPNKFYIIPIFILITMSCQKKVDFNQFEKEILNNYKVGDTLIFENSLARKDTLFIVAKDISYAKWNPLAHSGQYKYLSATVYYKSNKDKQNEGSSPKVLFILTKNHPDTTAMFLHYKKAFINGHFQSLGEKSLEKYQVADSIYKFNDAYDVGHETVNLSVFWHIKYGLIRYTTSSNECWVRIGIPPCRDCSLAE